MATADADMWQRAVADSYQSESPSADSRVLVSPSHLFCPAITCSLRMLEKRSAQGCEHPQTFMRGLITYLGSHVAKAVVYPNNVPEVQERSERSGRSERSERAEQCSEHSWACSGHVAKISMLRLNIGSGKLSSCMLSIGLGPKCEQGKGGQP